MICVYRYMALSKRYIAETAASIYIVMVKRRPSLGRLLTSEEFEELVTAALHDRMKKV